LRTSRGSSAAASTAPGTTAAAASAAPTRRTATTAPAGRDTTWTPTTPAKVTRSPYFHLLLLLVYLFLVWCWFLSFSPQFLILVFFSLIRLSASLYLFYKTYRIGLFISISSLFQALLIFVLLAAMNRIHILSSP
jgi:hypothetical protein